MNQNHMNVCSFLLFFFFRENITVSLTIFALSSTTRQIWVYVHNRMLIQHHTNSAAHCLRVWLYSSSTKWEGSATVADWDSVNKLIRGPRLTDGLLRGTGQTEEFIWLVRSVPRQSISPQICQFPPSHCIIRHPSPLNFWWWCMCGKHGSDVAFDCL